MFFFLNFCSGLGVVGWGVGGIEAEAVMLGQAISMLLPEVVGYKIVGELDQYVTSTDLVLTITKVTYKHSSIFFILIFYRIVEARNLCFPGN